MELHIGLDDTDSPLKGCTTYLGALLVERMLILGAEFLDYPILIRLNPNTPWKTRGNASVCIRSSVDKNNLPKIKDFTKELVDENSEFNCDNTNPGIVFLEGEIPEKIKRFSDKVVQQIVQLGEAESLIEEFNLEAIGYKNKRGLIGALAAIGGTLEYDHTFELLSYRNSENLGTVRQVDADSIRRMDESLKDLTYNNVDEKGKPLITPHGPDPVLCGIRGETPEAVYKAHQMIQQLEPVERWLIYRTNQGTDAHFKKEVKVSELKEFNPAIIQGKIMTGPKTIKGGHVILRLIDNTGQVDCAFYEPTRNLRHIVWQLIEGDELKVSGGIKSAKGALTINVEKLEILALIKSHLQKNPSCPICGASMESIGAGKGLRCKKCRYKDPTLRKIKIPKNRFLKEGIYLPDRNAQRHLTKPLERYGREKIFVKSLLFEPWHSI
jgi:tRNA(Ile2)-agmatinylcytidine synthase